MRFCKKASLNLSINAIVILILAITMLGLGLGFMKNLFGKTTGQLGDVAEDIKNQMIGELRRSNSKLTLEQEDITVKTGETKDVYFGVKNVLSMATVDTTMQFDIRYECGTSLSKLTYDNSNAGSNDVKIDVFDITRDLGNGEIDVQKFKITIESQAEPTTWPCKLILEEGTGGVSPGTLYSSKSFFVTVER